MKVKFKEWEGRIAWGEYGNGRIAFELIDASGDRIATPTVNIVAAPAPDAGWIDVKDWSENAGMVEALAAAGVIDVDAGVFPIYTGRAVAKRCKLSVAARAEFLHWAALGGDYNPMDYGLAPGGNAA